MNDELEIGGLYEYIGKHKSVIWLEKTDKGLDIQQVEYGDLFVLLKFDTKPQDLNFLVCKGLFVKTGFMGGFVCYRSEIRPKKE